MSEDSMRPVESRTSFAIQSESILKNNYLSFQHTNVKSHVYCFLKFLATFKAPRWASNLSLKSSKLHGNRVNIYTAGTFINGVLLIIFIKHHLEI